MIPDRILTELNQTLKAAAISAIEELDPKGEPGVFGISTDKFVRNFKKLWLLTARDDESSAALSGPLFFLFWKNLSVTNVSLNELISLIRTHTQYSGLQSRELPPGLINFQFSGDAEYTEFLFNMWDSFVGDATGSGDYIAQLVEAICSHIAAHYSLILTHTMIFDHYFTSALVNVPRSLSVRLPELVANSGYIHSAGLCIYIRNVEKAEKGELITQLNGFLDRDREKRYFLVPYAEEFFAPWEKAHSASSLRNGLDGVRFHFRKHNVGNLTLQEILALLPLETKGQILVPAGLREYWTERKESIAAGADPQSTIWFISDHNVHETDLRGYFSRGTRQYFIVYAQLIFNDNQLTLFKERKPGWTAPITLPHTLSRALINIAHEHWTLSQRSEEDNERSPIIVDPFCGTGTTLIDAKRRFDNSIVVGLDRNSLAYTLCKDNLSFFSESDSEAEEFAMTYVDVNYRPDEFEKKIDEFLTEAREVDFARIEVPSNQQQLFILLVSILLSELLFSKVARETRDDDLPTGSMLLGPYFASQIQRVLDSGFSLELKDFLESRLKGRQRRLCFLIWRGLVYGRFSVSRSEDLFVVIKKELDQFGKEERQYVSSLRAAEISIADGYTIKLTEYSLGSIITPVVFKDIHDATNARHFSQIADGLSKGTLSEGVHISEVSDSVDALTQLRGLVDILITDPPYGFNTGEPGILHILYGRLFSAAVDALRPGGQLIVALPDFSKNGRQIPFYQTRTAVIQQILSHALSEGRRILNYGDSVPGEVPLFRAPFYWTSTTGVSRSILHFTVG
jgi:hypothetical protein